MALETFLWLVILFCGIGITVLCLWPSSPRYNRRRLASSKNGRGREADHE